MCGVSVADNDDGLDWVTNVYDYIFLYILLINYY